MSLSPEQIAVLQARLDAAEIAYDRLMTGTSVAEWRDANGETMRYTAANSAKLARYIESLKTQINGVTNDGPLRPFFL
jgi:hypothetical protein